MKHSIPHDLDHALARKATRKALEAYRENFADYSPVGRWLSENVAEVEFTVMGNKLTGRVDVAPSQVELELKVPFMWRIFRKQAIKIIEGEIIDWIGRAKRGELDD